MPVDVVRLSYQTQQAGYRIAAGPATNAPILADHRRSFFPPHAPSLSASKVFLPLSRRVEIPFRRESRFLAESGCIYRMHSTIRCRFDVHTATRLYHIRTHALASYSNMSTASKPSALTFEIKGKCSVRHRHFFRCRLRNIDKFTADE